MTRLQALTYANAGNLRQTLTRNHHLYVARRTNPKSNAEYHVEHYLWAENHWRLVASITATTVE